MITAGFIVRKSLFLGLSIFYSLSHSLILVSFSSSLSSFIQAFSLLSAYFSLLPSLPHSNIFSSLLSFLSFSPCSASIFLFLPMPLNCSKSTFTIWTFLNQYFYITCLLLPKRHWWQIQLLDNIFISNIRCIAKRLTIIFLSCVISSLISFPR